MVEPVQARMLHICRSEGQQDIRGQWHGQDIPGAKGQLPEEMLYEFAYLIEGGELSTKDIKILLQQNSLV